MDTQFGDHMKRLSILTFLFLIATPAIAQEVPMGCYTRGYSSDHLAKHPEQVVKRISILFTQRDSLAWADVQVLLANQGHAARDGYGGMRLSEIAGSFNGPLDFGVECDGGKFDVIANDATGILIETIGFRLSNSGCDGDGIYSTLGEQGRSTTRYKLHKSDDASCDW